MEIPSDKSDIYNNQDTEPEAKVGFLRRMGRGALRKIFPYTITEFIPGDSSSHEQSFSLARERSELAPNDEPTQPVKLDVETSPAKVLAFSQDGVQLYSFDKDSPVPKMIESKYDAERLYARFVKMYFATGGGELSSEEVAELSGYQHTTVIEEVGRLSEVYPPEVFRYTYSASGKLRLHFGDVALATMLANSNLIEATESTAPQEQQERLIQEIDKNKANLALLDHAIIQKGKNSYYMPLQTIEAILGARTVEALAAVTNKRIDSESVAILTWSKMTVDERELFCTSTNAALSPLGPPQFEASVLAILRRLTNKLMITLEPKSDRFTIMNDELKITYTDKPITQELVQEYPNLKPIIPSSGKEVARLSAAERREHIDIAKLYTSQAKKSSPLEDDEAIAMLNFVMSPVGRWAINEISGTPDGYTKTTIALRVMHRYLRRTLRSGYRSARKNRQISGNRMIRNPDRIRHTGGRLSEKSQWGLGRSMEEILNHADNPEKENSDPQEA